MFDFFSPSWFERSALQVNTVALSTSVCLHPALLAVWKHSSSNTAVL